MLSSWSGLEPIPIYSIDLASFSGWGPSPAPFRVAVPLPAARSRRGFYRTSGTLWLRAEGSRPHEHGEIHRPVRR